MGKTSVAIQLAQWLDTEIISFDSRQFFRELKIGAAPPSKEELASIQHHLVGHLSVAQDYSAGDFEQDALNTLEAIFQKHEQAFLVGGSGMYMKALAEGFDEMPEIPKDLRVQLNEEFQEKGLEPLLGELRSSDPVYFNQVDRNNPQRVVRALEIIRATGKPYSDFRSGTAVERSFKILKIGVELPREQLYKRINDRVDQMVKAGLEEEVQQLLPYRGKNSMQTVGYREFVRYFDGEWDRETAISEIKKNSRRYAKRQMTWFRRDTEIKWFSPTAVEEMKNYILENTNDL